MHHLFPHFSRRWLRRGAPLTVALFVALSVTAVPCWGDTVNGLEKALKLALRDGRTADATKALDGLAKIATEEAVDVLVQVGLSQDNYDMERHVGGLIRGLPEGLGFKRACLHATKAKDYKVRVVLTLALGSRRELEAFTALVTNLHDPYDSVVLASLETVAKKNHLGAVPHLIKALELQEQRGKVDTTVWLETRKALLDLTGMDFSFAKDWSNFWAANGKNFKKVETSEKSRGVTSVVKDPPTFFGDEVISKHVVFVIDVSKSMEQRDPLPEEGVADKDKDKGRTSVGGANKKKPKPEKKKEIPESRMRLRRVQKELIAAIDKLKPETRFSIIAFNHEVKPWKDSLVAANNKYKREAIKFVEAFKPDGQTSTDLALKAAFDIKGVDTIFLLSDGKPRRQDPIPPDPIRAWVKETNRFRRVRVHTVAFEQTAGSFKKFMSKMAKQNNGNYKELR